MKFVWLLLLILETYTISTAALSRCNCEAGPQGPIGPQGDRGERGERGPTGPIGDTGPIGATGADGADGVVLSTAITNPPIYFAGLPGIQGPRGPDGLPGYCRFCRGRSFDFADEMDDFTRNLRHLGLSEDSLIVLPHNERSAAAAKTNRQNSIASNSKPSESLIGEQKTNARNVSIAQVAPTTNDDNLLEFERALQRLRVEYAKLRPSVPTKGQQIAIIL